MDAMTGYVYTNENTSKAVNSCSGVWQPVTLNIEKDKAKNMESHQFYRCDNFCSKISAKRNMNRFGICVEETDLAPTIN